MRQRIKHYIFIALAAAALYFVLDNHFVFYGRDVHLLKKTSLNLHNTFVSLDNKRPESVLQVDRLRNAGIGEILVDLNLLTEEKKNRLETKFNYE
jgi:hypothetical protein